MSLATSPSLPCRNLVYAMLRHISIKVQNRTGYTRRSWIHLLCEHFPRNMQKKSIDSDKNWEIYTSLKFSLSIKVQHGLAEPLPASQCAPWPTRWCRWVPHVVGKRASAFGGKHQRWPHLHVGLLPRWDPPVCHLSPSAVSPLLWSGWGQSSRI